MSGSAAPSAHRLLPLSVSVVLAGLLAGILLWLALDHYQTDMVGQVLYDDAVERLNIRAHRDRLRLDQRIRSHHGYVRMLAGQAGAQADLTADITWPGSLPRVIDGTPSWLPHRSLRRLFAQPDAFVVVDANDRPRTQYRLRDVTLPEKLAWPDRRLLLLGETEPTLNFYDGQLFLVASAPFGGGVGRLVGLARLDDEFLRQAQGAFLDDSGVTVLIAGEPQRVLASSDPDRVAPGTLLEALRAQYLVTGKGFLDYGFSEAQAGFGTLVARERLMTLTRPVLSVDRTQRTLVAAAMGGFFLVILVVGVVRLRRLIRRVAGFTEQAFGVSATMPGSGDELVDLERQVERLTSEVLSSRAALETETRERLLLLSETNSRLEREVEMRTRALRRALAEAQNATRSKSRFLASASHDLRQPLQAVRLFEAVLRQQLEGTPSEPVLDRLGQSVATAEVLLAALLDVSKIEAGVIVPQPAHFNVGALLQDVQRDFDLPAQQYGCTLRVFDCSAVAVADPLLVGRILRNLVSNAVKHGGDGRVLLGARRLPAGVRLEVWDEGRGISAEELPHIFEEFYQLDNPERDREKGLGLGLSIAKKLAELCHLPLGVRSVVGKGSVFSLTVPCSEIVAKRCEPTLVA